MQHQYTFLPFFNSTSGSFHVKLIDFWPIFHGHPQILLKFGTVTSRNCLATNILCGQCRKKVIQLPMEVPVEHSTPSTSEEEQLKSNDTTSVVASGSGTTDMNLSLFRTPESTFAVSLLFSCSFFPFSTETLE